jgi:hypothetical protein
MERVEQAARGVVVRTVGIHRIDQNVRINESRLNWHHRRCRGGEVSLRLRDATRVVQPLRRKIGFQSPTGAGRHPSPGAQSRCLL